MLRDVIASGMCPRRTWRRCSGQAEKSKIVGAAHAINRGEFPEDIVKATWTGSELIASDNPSIDLGDAAVTDCVWVDTTDKEDGCATAREILSFIIDDILPRRRIAAKEKLQVLSPMRKGNNSASTLNAFLREKLNAAEGSDNEFSTAPSSADYDVDILKLRKGDRVLQKRNDYTKEVFNGDLGVVTSINSNVATVTFNKKSIQYTKSEVLANLLRRGQ